MSSKKRFIAGASCQQCNSSDTLRWWVENNIEHVECVECGFSEQRKPQSIEGNTHAKRDMIGIFKPE
ncbi:YheV family putative zinc ribbon protein [Vibrio marisflavi]|uniref:YheV family putative zinc ribbon protein n=1 Tax=Vibrio marisflavi TaxID=1216040 RepID=UPI001F2957B4|nr:YheV family putative zinc ribbon protein [Vibrio marisflavi]